MALAASTKLSALPSPTVSLQSIITKAKLMNKKRKPHWMFLKNLTRCSPGPSQSTK